MTDLELIKEYLNDIVGYYSILKGNSNLISFLKREVNCIDECLNLVDLRILPLPRNCVENSRHAQRENLKNNNFLLKSKILNSEIIVAKLKSYVTMSEQEKTMYDAFVCLFPVEIESGDLLIEIFTDNILDCAIKEKDFLNILHSHFRDIVGNVSDKS